MRLQRRHWIVLIVGGLLLLVLGLSIPAIAKVRNAAARTHSTSNLKQLGLAIHNYSDNHQRLLPPGTIPNPALPHEQRLSWYILILPYMEQHAAYAQFDHEKGAIQEPNLTAATYRFGQITCPVKGEERITVAAKAGNPPAVTHYVALAGVGPDAAMSSADVGRIGALGYDRQITLNGFADGSSNTMMLIETAFVPGPWAHGGLPTLRGVVPGSSPYVGEGRPFGGFHPNSCLVGLADASARSVTPAISPATFEAATTVAGGESLGADW